MEDESTTPVLEIIRKLASESRLVIPQTGTTAFIGLDQTVVIWRRNCPGATVANGSRLHNSFKRTVFNDSISINVPMQ